jgi:septum formation protein
MDLYLASGSPRRAQLLAQIGLHISKIADTSVAIDGLILGKPDNHAHAVAMLHMLSGRTHQVISSVVVWHQGQRSQTTQTSEVTFRPLTEAEIQAYVDSGEADDKAGAYGIQGAAAVFIEHLSGSFSGVMGLPLFETAALLRSIGFIQS